MPTTYTCLIVDDEKAAHYVLQNYIARVSNLALAGSCYSVMEAIDFLRGPSVDLLFLDMEMPEISGLEMLKSFPNLPKTILTTAYAEYALESYEFGVVDYLLKPFEFSRFLKAIHRATEPVTIHDAPAVSDVLTIKVDNINKSVPLPSITYIQSIGNYVRVFTTEGEVFLTMVTLSKIEQTLPTAWFMRIHKSYIVNLQLIAQVQDHTIQLTTGQEIPVGITYQKLLEFRTHRHGKDS